MDFTTSRAIGLFQAALEIAGSAPYSSFFVIIALICVFTRIVTGLRSGPKEGVAVKKPYWIPYVGHALSFGFTQESFLAKQLYV